MSWDAELRFAHHLADIADGITMRGFTDRIGFRTKKDGTPVTDADEGAERALRDEIAKTFPDHAVIGEEEGSAGAGPARWILDPIDGTKNFAAGIPIWATLIALEVDGEIVCGVVSAPALRERYAAARGAGAECNGERIAVSGTADLSDARVAYTSFLSFDRYGRGEAWRRIAGGGQWARGFGDFWGHMLVASGRADVMAEPAVNVWDLAPLLVIAEEAGGRFTDLDGNRRADGGSALTTNGLLHDAVLGVFSSRPD
jgi:histidinol-phosphatase